MKIVFVGASRFGLRCLELVCRTPGYAVAGVVTAPQTFAISYRPEGMSNVLYADVVSFAADRGLPSRTLVRSMGEPGLLDVVAAWKPDAFLVAGWYHIVPKAWRDLAPAYGLHASLLPDYSGGAPLVWAMINGETKTGITMFQMDDGVDSGPIVDQLEEPILPDDTIATLYARIEERGLELLANALPRLANGSATMRPQSVLGRRVMPQRSPEDGMVDWAAGVIHVDRFIRAQTRPYPGAFAQLNGRRITIWRAHSEITGVPGHVGDVVALREELAVLCSDGILVLHEIEIDGCAFSGKDVHRALRVGSRLVGREGAL